MFSTVSFLLSPQLQGLISDMRAPRTSQPFPRERHTVLSWASEILRGQLVHRSHASTLPLGPLPPKFSCSSQTSGFQGLHLTSCPLLCVLSFGQRAQHHWQSRCFYSARTPAVPKAALGRGCSFDIFQTSRGHELSIQTKVPGWQVGLAYCLFQRLRA